MQIEMTEGQAGNVIMALGEVPALRDQLVDALRKLEEAEGIAVRADGGKQYAEAETKKYRQRIDKIAKNLSERDDCPHSLVHASLEDMMTHYLAGVDQEKREAAHYKAQIDGHRRAISQAERLPKHAEWHGPHVQGRALSQRTRQAEKAVEKEEREVMRTEMRPDGTHVTILEPGDTDNLIEATWENMTKTIDKAVELLVERLQRMTIFTGVSERDAFAKSLRGTVQDMDFRRVLLGGDGTKPKGIINRLVRWLFAVLRRRITA